MDFARTPFTHDPVVLRWVIRGTGGLMFLYFGYAFFFMAWEAIKLLATGHSMSTGDSLNQFSSNCFLVLSVFVLGTLMRLGFDMLCKVNFLAIAVFAFLFALFSSIAIYHLMVWSLMYLLQPHFPDIHLTSPHGLRSIWVFLFSLWALSSLQRRLPALLTRLLKPDADSVDYRAIVFRRSASS